VLLSYLNICSNVTNCAAENKKVDYVLNIVVTSKQVMTFFLSAHTRSFFKTLVCVLKQVQNYRNILE
jgi:hypothetical protein